MVQPPVRRNYAWTPPPGCLTLAVQNHWSVRRSLGLDPSMRLEGGQRFTIFLRPDWGIHGMFVEGPENPEFVFFDRHLIPQDLRDRALENWPSVIDLRENSTKESQSENLWRWEYNSKAWKCTMDQQEYMQLTLIWFDQVKPHLIQALNDNRYDNNKLNVLGFQNYFGDTDIGRPEIQVWYLNPLNSKKSKQFLKEIHFYSSVEPPRIYMYPGETPVEIYSNRSLNKPVFFA